MQVEEDLSSEVDALCEELTRRLLVFDLFKATESESTMREFIGPVLVQAVLMFQARDENPHPVKMVAERKLFGSLGNGPVDYILFYKLFNICVVGAKKEDFDQGINRIIAQMVASREDYTWKRQLSSDDLKRVPSCGIVSSGSVWVFLMYSFAGDTWSVRCSEKYLICLDTHQHIERAHVERVFRKVISLIKFEVDMVDTDSENQQSLKKAKT
jgi:hypothetical protein